MNREQIAIELMEGCPRESLLDHQKIADMIIMGKPIDEILNLPEMDSWPETYVWVKEALSKKSA